MTNPNATLAVYDVSVVFNLVDASGAILDTATETVSYIPANSTVPVAPLQIGFDNPTEPAGVKVDVAGAFSEDTGWAGVDFMTNQGIDLEVTGAKVAPGSFGSTDLSFTATNPSDQVTESGLWSCVLKRGGAIVGGESSGITDPIVPGSSVLVTSSVSVDGLTADEVICRAFA